MIMVTGLILMPIGGTVEKRQKLYEELSKQLSIVYVGLNDIKNVSGDNSLRADVIVSNLKTYMSHGVSHIFFDCNNQTPEQRKVILDLATTAKYSVIGLVLDTPNIKYTMVREAPDWDEGFKNIYYKD
jgi:predicted kinase